jgi:hypothetical protein
MYTLKWKREIFMWKFSFLSKRKMMQDSAANAWQKQYCITSCEKMLLEPSKNKTLKTYRNQFVLLMLFPKYWKVTNRNQKGKKKKKSSLFCMETVVKISFSIYLWSSLFSKGEKISLGGEPNALFEVRS